MKIIARYVLAVSLLIAMVCASAVLGYRKGFAASKPATLSSALPISSASNQDVWQYQTYCCGKKSDLSTNTQEVSRVVNAYAAKGFQPCLPPTGIFPEGIESGRLIWFRRQFNPFLPSIPSLVETTIKVNG